VLQNPAFTSTHSSSFSSSSSSSSHSSLSYSSSHSLLLSSSCHLMSLLITLKTFILESLQDKIIDSSKSLFEVLQWTEIDDVYLGDLPWFMGTATTTITTAISQDYNSSSSSGGMHDLGRGYRGFPRDILMAEAVAVYEMLSTTGGPVS
jgi:hypothetical protein